MSTPEENFEIAADESSDRAARESAIEDLEAANECDMLAELVQTNGLGKQFREQALTSLGHPQCKSMLQELVDSGDLSDGFQEQAEALLGDTPDDSGAGP